MHVTFGTWEIESSKNLSVFEHFENSDLKCMFSQALTVSFVVC